MASDEHQTIVLGLINHFKKKNFSIICAAYSGYSECDKQGRHEPDVVAKDSSGLLHIGEAETCDSLRNEDTIEQFKDFSSRSMTNDKRVVPFYIGIPKGCEDELLSVLKENSLTAENVLYITY